jgi:hypothetical protein
MERNDFDEDKSNVEHGTLRLQILILTGTNVVLSHSSGTKDLIRMDIAAGRWRPTCTHDKDLRNYFSTRCTIFAALPTMCSHSANFALSALANDVQSLRQSPSRVTIVRPKTYSPLR